MAASAIVASMQSLPDPRRELVKRGVQAAAVIKDAPSMEIADNFPLSLATVSADSAGNRWVTLNARCPSNDAKLTHTLANQLYQSLLEYAVCDGKNEQWSVLMRILGPALARSYNYDNANWISHYPSLS